MPVKIVIGSDWTFRPGVYHNSAWSDITLPGFTDTMDYTTQSGQDAKY
jgi:hypothetical protein